MEKPNFFKMAIDRNLYLAAPEVAEMCEHVWNTHVVPLKEEADLRGRQLDHYRDQTQKIRTFVFNRKDFGLPSQNIFEAVNDHITQIESENKALQEKLKIAEHLKELADDAIVTLQREVEKLKADNESLLKGALDNIKKHMHH